MPMCGLKDGDSEEVLVAAGPFDNVGPSPDGVDKEESGKMLPL